MTSHLKILDNNVDGPSFFGTPSDFRQVPGYMESMHRGPAFGVFRDKRCYNTRSNEPSVDPYGEHGSTWPPTIQGRQKSLAKVIEHFGEKAL
jgi:hypothetical protein